MNCEIISVGTELLTGDTVNTNAAYLSKELSVHGFSVLYHSVVGDNPERLKKTFALALTRSDIIITTGGLGPTQDDLTKETIAEILGRPMVQDEKAAADLETFFKTRDYPMTENNLRQTYVPQGSTVLYNPWGTAPGIFLTEGEQKVILLPGPPGELKNMFSQVVLPIINKLTNQIVLSRYYHLAEIGESQVEDRILDLIDTQKNPTIATYAAVGEVMIRTTANGTDEDTINGLLDETQKIIEERFADNIFAHDRRHLNEAVGELLIESNLSIAVAESCTGGLLATALTDVPGISTVFKEGLVTYANEAKENLLGVSHQTLMTDGAVSEKTAREMCENLLHNSGCEIAVSTTGIAGPGGGTEEKPVGLVYIGVATKKGTEVTMNRFGGERTIIRKRAVNKALAMVRRAALDISAEID